MKKIKKPKPQAGVEGLIHTMSDTALRAAFGVTRGEFPEEEFEIPALASVSAALRKLMPTTPYSVIERMVRDLVIDEILNRWRKDFDADMALGFREREKLKRKKKTPKLSVRERARGKR